MPRKVCCVPGCKVVAEDGAPLHCFPCPEKDAERFQNWVNVIGGDIATLDSTTIHKNRRICRRHFQKAFLYPKRLCKLAVPSLLLPSADVSAPSQTDLDCQQSTSQEAILLDSIVIQDSTRTAEYEPYNSAPSQTVLDCEPTTQEALLFDATRTEYNPCNLAPSQMVLDCEPTTSTTEEAILFDSNLTQDSTRTAEYEPCNSAPSMSPLIFECEPSTSQEAILHRYVIQPTATETVEYFEPSSTVPTLKRTHKENKMKKLEQTLKAKRKKYEQEKKMKKTKALDIVTEDMSTIIKSLFNMQVKGSGKKCRGIRFTPEEKTLALSLYKSSPKSYRLLSQHCVVPSRRTLQNILQKADLEPRIYE